MFCSITDPLLHRCWHQQMRRYGDALLMINQWRRHTTEIIAAIFSFDDIGKPFAVIVSVSVSKCFYSWMWFAKHEYWRVGLLWVSKAGCFFSKICDGWYAECNFFLRNSDERLTGKPGSSLFFETELLTLYYVRLWQLLARRCVLMTGKHAPRLLITISPLFVFFSEVVV